MKKLQTLSNSPLKLHQCIVRGHGYERHRKKFTNKFSPFLEKITKRGVRGHLWKAVN